MAADQIFLQRGWHGGIADDRFSGIPKSFQDSKAVEIRKNPSSLKLANKVSKDSSTIVTDFGRVFITIKSTGDVICFGDTGKIYRNATGAGTWVLVYTDTGNSPITGAYEYNNYLYWATTGHINRIAVANIDTSWAGDVTEDYKAFTNANTNQHPMIELYNKLYVGDGSLLAELDSLAVWTANKLQIFGDEEIRALTFSGAMMRIYARKSANVDHGRAYLWDGTATTYNEFVAWEGLRIHAAINKDGLDYVLAGTRPSIYVSTGYQRQLLKRLPGVTSSLTLNNEALSIYDDMLALGIASSGDAVGRGVWTWGSWTKDYPASLNFDHPTSNDNTTDTIGAVHSSNGTLYFSWKNGSNYGIDKVDKTKYATSGYLISRAYYGQAGFIEKLSQQLDLAFAQMAAGEQIDIYVRKNLSSSWGSAIATVAYSDSADQGVTKKRITNQFADGNFDFLEMKIVLTAGTSNATTPELIESAIFFEQIKR